MTDFESLLEKVATIAANTEHIRTRTEKMDEKLEKLSERDVRMEATIESAHKRIDAVEPKVSQHEELKNKAVGVVGFISFVFTVLGAGLSWLLQKVGVLHG